MTDYEPVSCCVTLGDDTWHGGPGWYWWEEEYPEEGVVGPYDTREAAIADMPEGALSCAHSPTSPQGGGS